jgi:hypothetical protein
LIAAFLAAASACNWHPISRALTWYGYIDTSGRMIIEERFGVAWPFADGRARVQIGGSGWEWAYIDRAGKPVITRNVKQGWSFSEGLALIGNGGPF